MQVPILAKHPFSTLNLLYRVTTGPNCLPEPSASLAHPLPPAVGHPRSTRAGVGAEVSSGHQPLLRGGDGLGQQLPRPGAEAPPSGGGAIHIGGASGADPGGARGGRPGGARAGRWVGQHGRDAGGRARRTGGGRGDLRAHAELVVVEVRRKSGGAAKYEEYFRAIHACSPAASRHAHARTFIVDHRMWRSASDSSWFAAGGARRRRWLPACPTWPRSFGSARPAPASSTCNSVGAGLRTPRTGTWE